MSCSIMRALFEKALYLIPIKMTPKRYDGRVGNFTIFAFFQFDSKFILRRQSLIQDGNLNNLSQ